jgi:competence protein ComEC
MLLISGSRSREAGRTSLVATLATAPVVAYHFGYVSVISVIANVLITIALMPILVLSMLSLAIVPFSSALATGLMVACVSPLAGWVLWVVETLGSWELSSLNVPEFSPFWLVPYYAAFLFLWRRRVRPA